jgi:hypothetical protein
MNQKEIALECLKKLDIYEPYIKRFAKDSTPVFMERFAGFYADQEPVLWDKLKKFQKETGCLVYAITHEFMEFGECWSMLCVPKDVECVEDCLTETSNNDMHYAFAYVWNVDDEFCSEFGDVVVKSALGGIRRIG